MEELGEDTAAMEGCDFDRLRYMYFKQRWEIGIEIEMGHGVYDLLIGRT
jgi:hypothetical protein